MANKKGTDKAEDKAAKAAKAAEKAAAKAAAREEAKKEKQAKKAKKQQKRVRKASRKAEKRAIPKGYHTVQAYLCVEGARQAIDFYRVAFGAEVKEALLGPDGKVMHAEVKIGDSVIMIGDARPEMGMTSSKVGFYLYVSDCDALYAQAITAGATPKSEPADMFWGDRFGSVDDPFGNTWSIATQKEKLTPKELAKRAEAFMAQMAAGDAGSCAAAPAQEAATPIAAEPQLAAS